VHADLQIRWLTSTSELRDYADPWNDLWRRSPSARPASRAEHLALWCDAFAHGSFAAAVVTENDRPLAALPLTQVYRWPLQVVRNPGNAWTPAGELLVDADRASDPVLDILLDGLREQAPGLLWLDGLIVADPIPRAFLARCSARGIPSSLRPRFDVPLIEICGTWGTYLASRSRNVRRQLQVIVRRASKVGGIELCRYQAVTPRQAESIARECFLLEASGWKGQSQSAVMSSPIASEFFLSQARQLAADGHLAIAALRHRGQLIAFEYGWQADGVRGVLKIGYHERYARLSPGQLLRYRLLCELFAEHSTDWVDFLGPASRATRAWSTHHYEVGRAVCAVNSHLAQLALAACRAKRHWLQPHPLLPDEPSTLPGIPAKSRALLTLTEQTSETFAGVSKLGNVVSN
jgi:CelD/BcsL family acetyltransferase involved in cellulose biosynthesis